MKVKDLKVFIVGNPPPSWGGRYFIFVKLTTDDGISGVGEVYAATFGPKVVEAMIKDVFERHVLGKEPFRIEQIWREVGRCLREPTDPMLEAMIGGSQVLTDLGASLLVILTAVPRVAIEALQAQANQKIAPLLQAYQLEWLADLFDSVLNNPQSDQYAPALIHGDLASYHLLLDETGQNLSGVIDFGMAGLGDPANDIGLLISIYGECFVQKMKPAYPQLDTLLPRARFYAQLLEIEWVLHGLESGETFWFTAHLGNARDIS